MCFYPKDCGPVAANVSKLVVFNSSLTFVSCMNSSAGLERRCQCQHHLKFSTFQILFNLISGICATTDFLCIFASSENWRWSVICTVF